MSAPEMAWREGLLALADGSLFEGEVLGFDAAGGHYPRRRRRGRLQHGHDGLPRGAHGPVLRRPDDLLHLPPHWQLRGRPR